MDEDDALALVAEICDRLDRVIALQESHVRELERLSRAIETLPTETTEPLTTGATLVAVPDPYPGDEPARLGRLIVSHRAPE